MKETIERELKLTPGEGFVLPELGGEAIPTRRFVSTYHDTADLILARHGVTFRHRMEDGAGVWQLKLPKGAARVELEVVGPPARPPEEMRALLVAYLRGREVVPVARLRTRREGVRAHGAEIVDDTVSVVVGQRVTRRFREVEVELLEGDERTLRRLESELRRAGATPGTSLRPKLYQALDLAGPVEPAVVPKGAAPAEALGIALAEQVRRVLLHDPGTRLGTDPEELHQFRVATRRLRAFLRAGRPLLEPTWSEPLRDELGWLGRAVGPARDLDVLAEGLSADLDRLGVDGEMRARLLAGVEAERVEARAAALEALGSDRYVALLDRLDHAGDPELSGDEVPLRSVWRSEWRRTRKALRALGDEPADEALHASRIRVKRARYAAELAEHELGKRGRAFVAAAKELQDVLGAHQDAAVAEERARAWAAADPGLAAVAARVSDLAAERKAAARAAWPAAHEALDAAARKVA